MQRREVRAKSLAAEKKKEEIKNDPSQGKLHVKAAGAKVLKFGFGKLNDKFKLMK